MKYSVLLVRHTILDERVIEAENKDEAEERAFMTFNSVDRNDYDEIWTEAIPIEDEEDER